MPCLFSAAVCNGRNVVCLHSSVLLFATVEMLSVCTVQCCCLQRSKCCLFAQFSAAVCNGPNVVCLHSSVLLFATVQMLSVLHSSVLLFATVQILSVCTVQCCCLQRSKCCLFAQFSERCCALRISFSGRNKNSNFYSRCRLSAEFVYVDRCTVGEKQDEVCFVIERKTEFYPFVSLKLL